MTECFKPLINGYKNFQAYAYPVLKQEYETLASQGQSPKILFISCCDSRVDPSLIFQAKPGELFVVRNVASLVPPFEQGEGYHGVSAAVEFAVTGLQVKHIVVMGHTACGGIRAMVEEKENAPSSFIGQWMKIGLKAKEQAFAQECDHPHERVNLASRYATLTSLENLRTFPFVQEREGKKLLNLHAWQFDILTGKIVAYNGEKKSFQELETYWQEDACGLNTHTLDPQLDHQG
jgi:carbonic anhydrase